MPALKEKIADFLAQKRIAVAGVSRDPKGSAANLIYQKLKQSGYEVFALNPQADSVEGERCYPDVKSIAQGVDGVVIVTRPEAAERIVRECAEAGVPRVWMHRSFGAGSVSEAAAQFCAEHNISVIAGACPMMFCPPVDFGHKCMRWILGATGKLPK
ncbi:MAG: CoA-binding protein [Calditrichaceae bacterium]|nr:CoA-binding protein [Calditrichia bacterium]NUQ40351.1 CoA-binding protein [Calditrichaceae bacterium]